MESRPHVVVVGGGISGLATAYFLRHRAAGRPPRVSLFESTDRLGGKILTRQVDRLPLDTGPDTLPPRPVLQALLTELGLDGELVRAASLGIYVWSGGKLRRVPSGTMLGVPDRIAPVLRSRVLSPAGSLRAGLDLLLPKQDVPDDPTIAQLLQPRFGTQVFDRLVAPLLGGMHSGPADQLSARSTVPDIETLARNHRSLYLALRKRRREHKGRAVPTLATLARGLGELTEALAAALADSTVQVDAPVTSITRTATGYHLEVGSGEAAHGVDADAVVFATPAFVTAELVAQLSPKAAAALREVPYTDVATVVSTYPADSITRPVDGTGFLVPPTDDRLIVGCTLLSAKWPHLWGRPFIAVRAIVGRAGDQRWMALDDAALAKRVHGEIAAATGLKAKPHATIVQRWPRGLPQYVVGHEQRLTDIDGGLARLPGVHVTGSAYRGVGVAGCVGQAEGTARAVLAGLARGAARTDLSA